VASYAILGLPLQAQLRADLLLLRDEMCALQAWQESVGSPLA
jgi:hypothetical protein